IGLASTATAAIVLPLEGLRFSPSEGMSLQKTYTVETDAELDDLSLLISGQDLGAMFAPSMAISASSEVTFTDVYTSVADGRPSKLERTFDTLANEMSMSMEMMGESQEEGSETSSPLEGQTIVFTWDDDAGEYGIEYADDSAGDEDLLADLVEDTDMRWLLPGDDVSVDDSWDFDPAKMQHLLAPSGNLQWEAEGVDDADMEEFEEMFGQFTDRAMEEAKKLLEGDSTATFLGAREVDGRQVGVVGIAVEIGSSADFASMMQEIIETAVEESGEEVPDDFEVYVEAADISLDVESEGEMMWDMETGTLYGMNMSADFEMAIDLVVSMTAEGDSQDLEVSAAFSGVMTAGVETER
ncbi:MAG: hypothetical protein ACYTFV_12180, partial [Planctomycetota bacterium]